jgi:hypothetical protein
VLGQRLKRRILTIVFVDTAESSMKTKRSGNRIDTTVGELIAAVSDAAFEYTDDPKEAYRWVRLALVEILKGASLGAEIVGRRFSTNKYLH